MKTLLKRIPKTRRHRRRLPPKPTGGFTMIELLVGMVIAALIITPMLAFVVNILNNDVREQAKTNTEQDLQAAMDYIAQDMSQAVYVYDPDYAGDTDIPSYATFEAQLPESTDTNKEPILVFWKREYVKEAVPINDTVTCPSAQCDDTFVLSLVAYYLIDDDNSTWCQPSGGDCPKRIARFQIQDGVKDLNGNYVCGADGRDETVCADAKKKFLRDDGFNDYQSNPTKWEKDGNYDLNENKLNVLVNYIEGFNLDNEFDSNGDGNIDANDVGLIEASGYKLAKIQIVGNALRRSQNDFSCEDTSATPPYKDSPYCPKATARVGARSGYGE